MKAADPHEDLNVPGPQASGIPTILSRESCALFSPEDPSRTAWGKASVLMLLGDDRTTRRLPLLKE
jgi:hypothetical protein